MAHLKMEFVHVEFLIRRVMGKYFRVRRGHYKFGIFKFLAVGVKPDDSSLGEITFNQYIS